MRPMKGVVLAGGTGSRLFPLTKITNKHLLPIYDRPMIYYPIQTLVDAGIQEILIVTGGRNSGDFLRLLSNGKQFGLKHINYTYQEGEGGIADALALAEHFADGQKLCVVLGDNIIEGNILAAADRFRRQSDGAVRRQQNRARCRNGGTQLMPQPVSSTATGRRLITSGELDLVIAECPKGIGSVISSSQSADLIAGVRVQPYSLYPDDRGYFLEVQRIGSGLAAGFPPESTQSSAALSYPGTMKAFHFHLLQPACSTPLKGRLHVVLADLRLGSPTRGLRNTMYLGALRPWQVLIPPGVAHGYKVIGREEAMLVYLTDRFYNPKDEGRIPYNDPGINYDWETQHK